MLTRNRLPAPRTSAYRAASATLPLQAINAFACFVKSRAALSNEIERFASPNGDIAIISFLKI